MPTHRLVNNAQYVTGVLLVSLGSFPVNLASTRYSAVAVNRKTYCLNVYKSGCPIKKMCQQSSRLAMFKTKYSHPQSQLEHHFLLLPSSFLGQAIESQRLHCSEVKSGTYVLPTGLSCLSSACWKYDTQKWNMMLQVSLWMTVHESPFLGTCRVHKSDIIFSSCFPVKLSCIYLKGK